MYAFNLQALIISPRQTKRCLLFITLYFLNFNLNQVKSIGSYVSELFQYYFFLLVSSLEFLCG